MPTFTAQQQASHCRQLADLLESDRVTGHYDHAVWFGTTFAGIARDGVGDTAAVQAGEFDCNTVACALGWAAVAHIGELTPRVGATKDRLYPALHDSAPWDVNKVADAVFGAGAYGNIFFSYRDQRGADAAEDRQISIELLRNHAALLETQPELA